MIEALKQSIKETLESKINEDFNVTTNIIVEAPKKLEQGDLSLPVFGVAKALSKPLPEVANYLKGIIEQLPMINEVTLTGGFINLRMDKVALAKDVLKEVQIQQALFGNRTVGINKTVVVDYSAPNIAKSFSIGHLRSTMIGHSLRKIYEKCGYKTVGINHLGDWGTQFGKMIVAYERWGSKEAVEQNTIAELASLYVRFHEEVVDNPHLDDEARNVFKQLEQRNAYYTSLWQWFRDASLKEFMDMYELLGVDFDSYDGEAFFNDKMDPVILELTMKGLLKEDQGAMIVDLGETMPPALIQRTDGATLYMTRDLAAVLYRKQTYQFDKALYVVGNEQRLHFNQMKAVIERMGYPFYADIEHVNFGLVLQDGKKMSTRKGKVVKLYDVLAEAISMAEKAIVEKNPELENQEEIAKKIGIGAVLFNDLKNHRTLDIEFDLESMLKFEGQTGPYLQYTGVRIASILRDHTLDIDAVNFDVFNQEHYFEIIRHVSQFGQNVERAMWENAPSVVAKYLLSLTQAFNKFYGMERIVSNDLPTKHANLYLITAVKTVLDEGLRLLGMEALERM